jgi:hypothetical protein
MRFSGLIRAPLVHFLLVGLLLFAVAASLDRIGAHTSARALAAGAAATIARADVAIDADRVEELRRELADRSGRAPSRAELDGLIARTLDEELLYREALARGLAEDDPAVETRLVQKMLFLDDEATLADGPALLERARALGLDREDIVIRRILAEKLRRIATTLWPDEVPGEALLARAYHERREELRTPERRSLIHVFLSRDRRGDRTRTDAEALARKLAASELDPAAAARLGDVFPAGHVLVRRSRADLERQFGEAFGERVAALSLGSWSEPLPSAYGLHLVRVDEVVPGEIPPFESVSERIRGELESAIRARKLEGLLAELRTRYEVAVVGLGEE